LGDLESFHIGVKMVRERLQLFLEIVKSAYLGEKFSFGGKIFELEPRFVSPYDFIRKIPSPKSKFDELLSYLNGKSRKARIVGEVK